MEQQTQVEEPKKRPGRPKVTQEEIVRATEGMHADRLFFQIVHFTAPVNNQNYYSLQAKEADRRADKLVLTPAGLFIERKGDKTLFAPVTTIKWARIL